MGLEVLYSLFKIVSYRSKFLYFYFVSTFSVFDRGDGRYVQSR